MTTYELIVQRRTIRKYEQKPVPKELLDKCVNAARMGPSSANLQPLEYIVVDDPEQCQRVFPQTAWARYLDNGTPGPDERPTAYIFILTNTQRRANAPMDVGTAHIFILSKTQRQANAPMDVGIAAQNIVLVALEEGVASCMIGSLDHDALQQVLVVPDHCEISLAIALGYPAEQSAWEEMAGDSIKYYRDDEGILHVPKRSLADLVHRNQY